MANWEEGLLALSERARRAGAAYAGPGAGNDIPRSEKPPIAFTGGLPDPTLLPAAELAEATATVLANDPNAALQYGGAQGFEGLRLWLAEHWSAIEGFDLGADSYTLTNGSAGALENVCQTFVDAGDVVGVEAPSFPGSIRAIRSITPRIESIPVDDDGIDVEALAVRLFDLASAGESMRALYTIPSFQNPTGSTLTVERRRRLLDLCSRYGVLVIEDDAYGELSFGAAPPPSLFSLSRGEGVIKIGTFSKIVAPGLRVGWCQASPATVDALVATRSDMGSSPLVQRVLATYAADGALEKNIEEIRAVYARKCGAMLAALDSGCSAGATWNQPSGGFFVWVTLGESVDGQALVEASRAESVSFVGGRAFFAEQTTGEHPRAWWAPSDSRNFRLAFSYVPEDQIPEGCARLARALHSATSS